MYSGMLLLYYNPLSVAFTLFVVLMLLLQILQEERYRDAAFWDTYAAYRSRGRRYLGIALSLGMPVGLVVGFCISKKSNSKDK